MKSEFAEYYRPSEAAFDAIWKDSIIAFDASALLNLYFYSEPTAQTVLSVMGLLKDRIWLPHQAGLEYQRNRLGVLGKVAKGYSEAVRRCRTFWKKAFENSAGRWAARKWIVVS